MLSANQIADYQQNGFLVLPNFMDDQQCDQLRQQAQQLLTQYDPQEQISLFSTHAERRPKDNYFLQSGDKIRCFFEEHAFDAEGVLRQAKELSINKIGHALHDLDPIFAQFSHQPAIAQLVTSLGIANPLLVQSMYIFKQPHIGGEVSCHQDSTFLYTEPPNLMGLWFALEDATTENGCLWAIPGGHKSPLKSRYIKDAQGDMVFEYYENTPWPTAQLIPLPVSKGSVIVLHGLLPHMSLENSSAHSRHAYILHIIDREWTYPANNWLQRSPTLPFQGF